MSKVGALTDRIGVFTPTGEWTRWARVRRLSGAGNDFTVIIPRRDDVAAGDVITFRGRRLSITDVADLDGRNKWLRISATEVDPVKLIELYGEKK